MRLYLFMNVVEIKFPFLSRQRVDDKLQKEQASYGISCACKNSLNMTLQLTSTRFNSKRGYFWLVLVKCSKIVGFSCLERHISHKAPLLRTVSYLEWCKRSFLKGLKTKEKLSKFNCPRALVITCLLHEGQHSVQRKTFQALPSSKQVFRLSVKNKLAVERGK